jgi:hypothetical protein
VFSRTPNQQISIPLDAWFIIFIIRTTRSHTSLSPLSYSGSIIREFSVFSQNHQKGYLKKKQMQRHAKGRHKPDECNRIMVNKTQRAAGKMKNNKGNSSECIRILVKKTITYNFTIRDSLQVSV